MKVFIITILLLTLISCSQKQEVDNVNGNTSGEIMDSEKINQIKNLLSDPEKETKSNTGIIENTKNTTPVIKQPITKTNTENKDSSKKTETGILTEEEIDIIENTNDGEIDELIDILFKDLN